MKNSTLLLLFICLISIAGLPANAKDKNMEGKESELPCTCVFNKNRAWNPTKIIWNDQQWLCSKYNENGTCATVALVDPIDADKDPCLNDTVPLHCIFNLENAPKSVQVNDSTWECLSYNNNNKCTEVHKLP